MYGDNRGTFSIQSNLSEMKRGAPGYLDAWPKLRSTLVLAPLVASVLFVSGCSDEKKAEQKIDYTVYDDAAVAKMIDEGKYKFAIDVIKGQAEAGMADAADYQALTRIYLMKQDGVAAEVAIMKAFDKGADKDRMAVQMARALFLQNKVAEAKVTLDKATLRKDEKPEANLLWGDIANASGKVADARYYYRAAVSDMPDDFRSHLALSLFELAQGNLDVAQKEADAAAALQKDNALIAYARGMVARYEGKAEAALTLFKKAAELQPDNVPVHLEMAGIYIDDGKREEAQKQLDIVFGIVPQHPMANYYSALMLAQAGNLRKADALLVRTGDLTKNYPPAARTYGLVAYQLGKYSTAEPYLERYLAVAPADRLARLALAESLAHRGRPDEAMQRLAPLLGKDKGDREAYIQAAAAAASAGDIKTARSFYTTALGMKGVEGDETPAQRRLLEAKIALAEFISGNTKAAREKLEALYKNSGDGDEGGLIILANMQLQSGDLDSAEETAGKMLKDEGQKAAGYNILGAVRYRQGRYDEAVKAYGEALTLTPDYQSALKNRGLAYMAAGKFDLAKGDLAHLAEDAPNDVQTKAMLGHALLELDKPNEALVYLREARKKIPKSAIIATDYAEALEETGVRAAALDEARAAIKLAGDRVDLVKYLSDLIDKWEKADQESQAKAEEARTKARKELEQQRAEQAKRDAETRARLKKIEEEQAAEEKAAAEKAKREKAEEDSTPKASEEGSQKDSGDPEKAPATPE